jgi:hypothetical protein
MTDPFETLNALHRPRYLVGAARHALADWRRDRDLPRVMRSAGVAGPGLALSALLSLEADLEVQRIARAVTYRAARHVDVLAGVMAEARLAQARSDGGVPAPQPAVPNLRLIERRAG